VSSLCHYADVSVVIPCFNSVSTIERAVKSVHSQQLIPREVIIVDDGSNIETLNELDVLEAEYKEWIRIIRLDRNVGAASARNIGWDYAKQTYIAFLDSDDSWLPQKIKIQYEYMRSNPNLALTGHDFSEVSSDKASYKSPNSRELNSTAIRFWSLLLKNKFVTPSVMLKRKLPLRFQTGKRFMEDHLLWLEVVSAGYLVEKLNIKLVNIYKPMFGASGLSANLWEMEKAELDNFSYLKETQKVNKMQMYFLQCFSLLKYLRRKLIVFIRKRVRKA
jgi:glycosyltransferase involved in cell wall biosynthesis